MTTGQPGPENHGPHDESRHTEPADGVGGGPVPPRQADDDATADDAAEAADNAPVPDRTAALDQPSLSPASSPSDPASSADGSEKRTDGTAARRDGADPADSAGPAGGTGPADTAAAPEPGRDSGVPGEAALLAAVLGSAAPPKAAISREAEEDILRRLLQDSVRDLRPADGALDTLHHAVPVRRRQRRRLMTAATTVVVLAVGAPVTLHTASVVGDSGSRTVEAGHDQRAGGSTGGDGLSGDGPGSPANGGERGAAPGESPEAAEESGDGDDADPGGPGSPDEAGSSEAEGSAGSYPRCDREQLGNAVTDVRSPDDTGVIYGAIRLSNISALTCRVRGTDELSVTAVVMSETSAASVPQVVLRSAGDRAPGLPLADEWLEELVLAPGDAYEVRFAWVPSRSAVNGGCSVPDTETLPADTGSAGSGSGSTGSGGSSPGSGTSGSSGSSGSGGRDDSETGTATIDDEPAAGGGGGGDAAGGGASGGGGDDDTNGSEGPGDDGSSGGDGSGGGSSPGSGGSTGSTGSGGSSGSDEDGVVVRYTPAAGTPRAAQVELPGACSGSLHRTGVLAVPSS
ncbi:hypothetical protein [Streptomyces otsuchiensis]|uniref:hypothetical protein n=1 Tax=Streptomyces otsuchiensis TaxID=2681388 RepID=UPI001031E510|nr:hypothetical protein [Streptomyces otsuchiensis]